MIGIGAMRMYLRCQWCGIRYRRFSDLWHYYCGTCGRRVHILGLPNSSAPAFQSNRGV